MTENGLKTKLFFGKRLDFVYAQEKRSMVFRYQRCAGIRLKYMKRVLYLRQKMGLTVNN